MEEFSIKFLNNEGNPITRETVNELVHNIQKNCCSAAWLALENCCHIIRAEIRMLIILNG